MGLHPKYQAVSAPGNNSNKCKGSFFIEMKTFRELGHTIGSKNPYSNTNAWLLLVGLHCLNRNSMKEFLGCIV